MRFKTISLIDCHRKYIWKIEHIITYSQWTSIVDANKSFGCRLVTPINVGILSIVYSLWYGNDSIPRFGTLIIMTIPNLIAAKT